MIIVGYRQREVWRSSGNFYCPHCLKSTSYSLMEIGTYFTLYFLPLFKIRRDGAFVLCRLCKGRFKPSILDRAEPRTEKEILIRLRRLLERGTPVEVARGGLLSADFKPQKVEMLLERVAGTELSSCRPCQLHFHPDVRKCSKCHEPLTRWAGPDPEGSNKTD